MSERLEPEKVGVWYDSPTTGKAPAPDSVTFTNLVGRTSRWYCADRDRIYRSAPTHCKRRLSEAQHRSCGWRWLTPVDGWETHGKDNR